MPVNIETYRYWHLWSFLSQFWTKNGKSSNFDSILYFAQMEHGEFSGDNSFLGFLMPGNIDNCQYWYLLSFRPQFLTKKANAPGLIKFCTLHKTKVVNSMVSILRGASGCSRKLNLGIEKQMLCQKYYCCIINKTGKKLWLTFAKLFS